MDNRNGFFSEFVDLGKNAIIRPYKIVMICYYKDRSSIRTHAWINNNNVYRLIREGFKAHLYCYSCFKNILRTYSMCDVNNIHKRIYIKYYPFHNSHKGVFMAKVSRQGNYRIMLHVIPLLFLLHRLFLSFS